ncbi:MULTISPECIES: DUF2281 domain-containing protein [Oceanobacillus]|uniref:DUF2281 domain-containing protein n=1 Tax=Oceanobacillus indicireducens TaxID=1004261 RepID=A0A917Y5M1_9BACI|nr:MULTISPECIES: DUF2281 domain-containing protein [Oceanobacillus]GGN66954.1 hypothetical protein GCM10007971_37410 [Oceanobacillus indicireducens]
MNTAKDRLLKIIDEIPEKDVDKILDFAEFLKAKSDKSVSEDLTEASESSLDFWDNDIDDEVWNNV